MSAGESEIVRWGRCKVDNLCIGIRVEGSTQTRSEQKQSKQTNRFQTVVWRSDAPLEACW
eukprot:4902842-Pleurochrysis_carterae.AAC.6